jgi:exopolysaccharide biosynthesis polyprenyl glycosylphosphotransferase
MRNNASLIYSIFLVFGDFLALIAAFAAAYLLRFRFLEDGKVATVDGTTFIYAIISILPVWLLVHAFIGLYRQDVYEKRFVELGRLLVGAFLGTMTIISYDFLVDGKLLPGRLVPVYAFLLGYLFLLLFRNAARLFRHQLYRFGGGVSNILIIGNTSVSDEIAHEISNTPRTGLRVLGVVDRKLANFRSFDGFEPALDGLKDSQIHGIIQTELYRNQLKNNEILRYAQTHHISYRFVPGNSDLFVGNIAVELFAGLPVIAVHQTALIGWGRVIKRLFDLFVTTVGMVIALPLMIVVAIIMKISEPKGDVFFRQIRLTRFNREFKVYKFRTIKTRYNKLDPEDAFAAMGKPELIKQYRDNGDFLSFDPRYGRLGNFLRSTSLDELPQLFNVLKGDISLVGPRALIPRELNAYEKKHSILSVKSGLTGLAQISGRREISFEERRKLDVYYVQNWSFWQDISILIRTVRAILSGTGGK